MCVIAALDLSSIGSSLWVILQVVVALGFVIFVHELGHFAVAKACGVKCPKFYVGFDVPLGQMINKLFGREGDKVFGIPIPRTIGPRIQIGETEYGIGIVPLGGYVRMLGQDDDPANIEQQLKESQVSGNTTDAKEVTGPDGKVYLIDRRSYMAKSVPQRMAIISAGVTMNIIFAFIFAVIAYKLGVPYNPSIVSQTGPGSPAWQADIRPGDEVVKIADVEQPSYDDLRGSVMLGDLEGGVPFEIRRGSDPPMSLMLFPKQGSGLPRVGIAAPASLRLPKELLAEDLSELNSSAPLVAGDEIVAVDGTPVTSYAEFSAILARSPEKPLVVRVRRGGKPPADDAYGALSGGEMVDVTLNPRPVKNLGLVMEMGQVTAVQEHSPAKGKIKPGDLIEAVTQGGDGAELTYDPMTLPDDLRRLAEDGGDVTLKLKRAAGKGDSADAESLVIPLRRVEWIEGSLGRAENDPVVVTALGVAYSVSSVVDRVEPGSPAEMAGFEPGDVITKAEFVYPADYDEDLKLKQLEFSSDPAKLQANWPTLVASLQLLPQGGKVTLTYKRGNAVKTATLTPATSTTYFLAERGVPFALIERIRTAKTWGEAVDRGWNETVSALGMVYRFLGKLGRQVPLTGLGGPVTIFNAASAQASQGPGKLLVFLTMLSANLAVINFLPIPLLDGGHMVFLLWEGIRGKPASEKFVMAMHSAGLVFLVTLMLFVLSLDFGWIPRNL